MVTIFRLWFTPRLDLVGDEAHYWECGRALDWSHYGKGPGAAFVIRIFTLLLGDLVWVVRLPAVLLAAGTGWLVFLLGRTFYNDRVGFFLGGRRPEFLESIGAAGAHALLGAHRNLGGPRIPGKIHQCGGADFFPALPSAHAGKTPASLLPRDSSDVGNLVFVRSSHSSLERVPRLDRSPSCV